MYSTGTQYIPPSLPRCAVRAAAPAAWPTSDIGHAEQPRGAITPEPYIVCSIAQDDKLPGNPGALSPLLS